MSVFHPQNLHVNLIPPATFAQPVDGRKYTLTHSDITGELFLDIGYAYNHEAIDPKMRDEVLAEWQQDRQGRYYLVGTAHVDEGEFNKQQAGVRFHIFKKEMDTALKGIVYGDQPFYVNYPILLDAPILLIYESAYPEYRQVMYDGTPRDYLWKIYGEKGMGPSVS